VEGVMNLIVSKNKLILKYLEREYRRWTTLTKKMN
jgi:hypothetical protein